MGGARIEKYKYADDHYGWFPVESIGFGFQEKAESEAGGAGAGAGASTAGRPAASASRPPAAAGASNKSKEEDAFTGLDVGRLVDRATPWLMARAMEDRNIKKNEFEKMYLVDVHLFHSVRGGDQGNKEDMFIYPYLLIVLGKCILRGWSMSAASDDRPTENFKVYFNQAAMKYSRTADGKIWNSVEMASWDQTTNKVWDNPGSEFFKTPGEM